MESRCATALLLALLFGAGCRSAEDPVGLIEAGESTGAAEPARAGATGTQRLALTDAAPGLCEGFGATKECDGDGCTSSGGGGLGGAVTYGNPGATGSGAPAIRLFSAAQGGGFCDVWESESPSTLYLSADDSNSTASPVIARNLIQKGFRVPAEVVRVWEFLNYYTFSFEPARPKGVRVVPQLSSCPDNGRLSFQVALSSETREPETRPLLNITFVLDTSGSMGGLPIELERRAVKAVASRLKAGDIVSMVTWDTSQSEILAGLEVTGPNDPRLVGAADSLSASGGTDLHSGLVNGYALAGQHHSVDRINRIVLISDGMANVGVTEEKLIGDFADEAGVKPEIYLAGVGVGDGVNDTLMDVVTDIGRGAYVYLDSVEEADKMLGERLLQVLDLAARDVRLEVTLPWYLNVEKFFGEEISTDANEVRPQHLAPNDAMLFFQVLKACDPSVIAGDDEVTIRATWTVPFTHQPKEALVRTTLNGLAGDDRALRKAAAVAGYAEALRLAAEAKTPDLARRFIDDAFAAVRAAPNADTDPDLVEIQLLLARYAELW